jgi:hypothetical protein
VGSHADGEKGMEIEEFSIGGVEGCVTDVAISHVVLARGMGCSCAGGGCGGGWMWCLVFELDCELRMKPQILDREIVVAGWLKVVSVFVVLSSIQVSSQWPFSTVVPLSFAFFTLHLYPTILAQRSQ